MDNGIPTKLYIALLKAQAEMGKLHKDSQNPHLKNKYASLAAVLDTVRGPLSANGLVLYQAATTVDAEPGLDVVVTTALIHAESGQQIAERLSIPLAKITAQEIGSAITYGRRYLAMAMCGLAPDDDDGNAASSQPAQRTVSRQPAARPAPDADAEEIWRDAPPVDSAPPKLGSITKTQLGELHALGAAFYNGTWDEQRPLLVKAATKGASDSSNDLTQVQAQKLITGLQSRLSVRLIERAAECEIDLNDILPAHKVKTLDGASPVALVHIYKDVLDKALPEAA